MARLLSGIFGGGERWVVVLWQLFPGLELRMSGARLWNLVQGDA